MGTEFKLGSNIYFILEPNSSKDVRQDLNEIQSIQDATSKSISKVTLNNKSNKCLFELNLFNINVYRRQKRN